MTTREIGTLVVVFLANIVEAITGFAGTMLAMPAGMLLLGVKEAKTVLNVVAIFVSAIIALKNRRDIDKKEAVKLTLLMLAGMAVGLYLFSVLPVAGLAKLYGVLIILVAAKGLLVKKEAALPGWALVGVVLGAGVIHGMFLSGGALLVLYAVAVLRDKAVIRATLAPVWIALNAIILAQDIAVGSFTPHSLGLALACLPPVALALYVGNKLHQKIEQAFFVKLTYVLLVVSGVTLLV